MPALDKLEIQSIKMCKDQDQIREAADAAVRAQLSVFTVGMVPPFDQAFKEAATRC